MRTFRLDPALLSRLEEASRVSRQSVSTIVRHAIEARCDAILGRSLSYEMRDLLGVVCTSGGRARRTGDAFHQVLRRRRERT